MLLEGKQRDLENPRVKGFEKKGKGRGKMKLVMVIGREILWFVDQDIEESPHFAPRPSKNLRTPLQT